MDRRRNMPREAALAARRAIRRVSEALPEGPRPSAAIAAAARELDPPVAWQDIANALGYADHTTLLRAVRARHYSEEHLERARFGLAVALYRQAPAASPAPGSAPATAPSAAHTAQAAR